MVTLRITSISLVSINSYKFLIILLYTMFHRQYINFDNYVKNWGHFKGIEKQKEIAAKSKRNQLDVLRY